MSHSNRDKNGDEIVTSPYPIAAGRAFAIEFSPDAQAAMNRLPKPDESQHPKVEVDGMFRVSIVYPAWKDGEPALEQNHAVVYRAQSMDEARRVRLAIKSALLIGAHCVENETIDSLKQAMQGMEEWLR